MLVCSCLALLLDKLLQQATARGRRVLVGEGCMRACCMRACARRGRARCCSRR